MPQKDGWASAFADAFAAPGTPVEQRVYAEVLGDEHPAELDTYSLLTWGELERMEQWLALRPGELLVDLGCGRAGPGTWVARRAGARLLGLDVTAAPFDAARARAARAAVRADFALASFGATGLPDRSVDAVLSVDAVQFADDPVAALAEVARILRPGGRVALTGGEHVDDLDDAVRGSPVTVERARAAGLAVAACDTPDGWPAMARRVVAAMHAASDGIAAASGADPAEVRDALERLAAARRQERRVVLLASRPQ